MKTIDQLKTEIYHQVQNSGFFKNVQSQVKAHVLDLIDKDSKNNKDKLGFQYEHPVLKKMRNYPLTSLCMDLVQEFLESFKFKHTLGVFKKQINRDLNINRQHLSQQFSLDLSAKDQSVLLSIVGQIFNGEIKILQIQQRQETVPPPRKNNFMGSGDPETQNNNKRKDEPNTRDQWKAPQKDIKPPQNKKYDIPDPTKLKNDEKVKQQHKKEQEEKKRLIELEKLREAERLKEIQRVKQLEKQQQLQKQKQLQKQQEEKDKKKKGKGKKIEEEKKKKSELPSDLLSDVVGKFKLQKDKKKTAQEEFNARKAYSEEKGPKIIVPEQSGSNKIRGISMGKMAGGVNSFMKFSSFNQPTKNQSIDEELDQLQQSKDSTRRNPLYSSSESGFDKSNGYDQSVDSQAIEDYEYFERAKKFTKK